MTRKDLSSLDRFSYSGIDLLRERRPTDAVVKSKILSCIENLPDEINLRLYRLSENKREQILHKVSAEIQSKIMEIVILKNSERTSPEYHPNIMKAANLFSMPIVSTLLETNLRYHLSMVEEPDSRLPIETQNVIQKALAELSEDKNKTEIKNFQELLNSLSKPMSLELLGRVFQGAHLDLTEIMKRLKRPNELETNVFFDLFISMMNSISKVLLLTRIKLELMLVEEGRKRKEEITAVIENPYASKITEMIETVWENGQSFYLFVFEMKGKRGQLYRHNFEKNLNKLISEVYGANIEFSIVQTGPGTYFTTIIGKHNIDLCTLFNKMNHTPEIRRALPDIAMTFIEPSLYDKKLEEYKGEFNEFLDEVVVNSILSHLREGLSTIRSTHKGHTLQIACGEKVFDSENFKEITPEQLSATQITHIYNLGEITEFKEVELGVRTVVDPLAEVRAIEMQLAEERNPETQEEKGTRNEKPSQDTPKRTEETKPIRAKDLLQGLNNTAKAESSGETGESPQNDISGIIIVEDPIIQEEDIPLFEEREVYIN